MQTLRNKLIALAALGLLAVIGSLMNSRQATAEEEGRDVTVINTSANPVPVTGSTKVSGNVGIAGQPIAVNVNNSPTVGLAAGATVAISGTPYVNATIANSAASPLLVSNVADSLEQSYFSSVCETDDPAKKYCVNFIPPTGTPTTVPKFTPTASQ